MDKLTYKTFTWPQNPHTYKEECIRQPHFITVDRQTYYEGMGQMQRIITGTGTFFGDTAIADFQRLVKLFEENDAGWMVVSEDRTEAIVGWYHALNEVNVTGKRLKLAGLNPDIVYNMQVPSDAAEEGAVRDIGSFYGDDLMNAGIASRPDRPVIFDFAFPVGDFTSEIFLLKAADEN